MHWAWGSTKIVHIRRSKMMSKSLYVDTCLSNPVILLHLRFCRSHRCSSVVIAPASGSGSLSHRVAEPLSGRSAATVAQLVAHGDRVITRAAVADPQPDPQPIAPRPTAVIAADTACRCMPIIPTCTWQVAGSRSERKCGYESYDREGSLSVVG